MMPTRHSPGCVICRFVYESSEGLFPHDLARDVLDANLRWRDPDGYKVVFRRVWTDIRDHLRSTRGREQRRAISI